MSELNTLFIPFDFTLDDLNKKPNKYYLKLLKFIRIKGKLLSEDLTLQLLDIIYLLNVDYKSIDLFDKDILIKSMRRESFKTPIKDPYFCFYFMAHTGYKDEELIDTIVTSGKKYLCYLLASTVLKKRHLKLTPILSNSAYAAKYRSLPSK